MTATVAALTVGALGALAAVEVGKYKGSTMDMLDKENPWALAATAIFGAIGGWVGSGVAGGVTSTVSSTFSGHGFSNLTSWLPSAIGYGTGTAIGSTVTTGLLDITNIVNPSAQDYIDGMKFGLFFGGAIGANNYMFHTSFSVPVGVIGEGSYFFTTTPIPKSNESR